LEIESKMREEGSKKGKKRKGKIKQTHMAGIYPVVLLLLHLVSCLHRKLRTENRLFGLHVIVKEKEKLKRKRKRKRKRKKKKKQNAEKIKPVREN